MYNVFSQVKYKESGKKEMSTSLYATMPDTLETSFAREVTDMQSEVDGIDKTFSTIRLTPLGTPPPGRGLFVDPV